MQINVIVSNQVADHLSTIRHGKSTRQMQNFIMKSNPGGLSSPLLITSRKWRQGRDRKGQTRLPPTPRLWQWQKALQLVAQLVKLDRYDTLEKLISKHLGVVSTVFWGVILFCSFVTAPEIRQLVGYWPIRPGRWTQVGPLALPVHRNELHCFRLFVCYLFAFCCVLLSPWFHSF